MAPPSKNNERRGGKRGNAGCRGNGDDARKGQNSSDNQSRKANDGSIQKATKDVAKTPKGFLREVEPSEVKRLRDDDGETLASKLVNTSQRGDAQMTFKAHMPEFPGGVTVTAKQGNFSVFQTTANQIMANRGAPGVAALMVPNDPRVYQRTLQRFPSVRETRESISVFGTVRDTERHGKGTIVVAEDEDEAMNDPADDQPQPKCMACGREGHELKNCVYPGDDGCVKGCVLCNSPDHGIDWCVGFERMPVAEKVGLLVRKRANMPCFPTNVDWIEETRLLVCNPLVPVIRSFPWTKEFGRKIAADPAALANLARYYIHGCDAAYLPKDPATKDLASFMETANANAIARKEAADAATAAPTPEVAKPAAKGNDVNMDNIFDAYESDSHQ